MYTRIYIPIHARTQTYVCTTVQMYEQPNNPLVNHYTHYDLQTDSAPVMKIKVITVVFFLFSGRVVIRSPCSWTYNYGGRQAHVRLDD